MESDVKIESTTEKKLVKFKKKYLLKCFYPATKQYADQSYKKTINADRFWTDDGAYHFAKANGSILCCYPIPYTIIEEIIEND